MRHLIGLVMLLLVAATAAPARDAKELLQPMSNKDRRWLVEGADGWLTVKLADFDACRGTSPGLTVEAASIWRSAFEARILRSATLLVHEQLATFDLDGDGQVIGAEIQQDAEGLDRLRARFDRNHDGEIGRAEVDAYVQSRLAAMEDQLAGCHDMFAYDTDGNGVLERSELEGISEAVAEAVQSQCGLPRLAYTHVAPTVLAVGRGVPGPEGGMEVEIRPQSDIGVPYVVFSKEPVAWRYRGDPERVSVLVVAGPAIGVLGLPDNKIVRVPRTDCTTFRPAEATSVDGFLTQGRIAHALGLPLPAYFVAEEADFMPPPPKKRRRFDPKQLRKN